MRSVQVSKMFSVFTYSNQCRLLVIYYANYYWMHSSCTRSQEWVVWTVGPLIRLCHTRQSLGNRPLTFTTSILNQLYLIQTNASFMNRLLISSQTQVISTYKINKCIRTFMLTKHCLSNICLEVSLILEAFFGYFVDCQSEFK